MISLYFIPTAIMFFTALTIAYFKKREAMLPLSLILILLIISINM